MTSASSRECWPTPSTAASRRPGSCARSCRCSKPRPPRPVSASPTRRPSRPSGRPGPARGSAPPRLWPAAAAAAAVVAAAAVLSWPALRLGPRRRRTGAGAVGAGRTRHRARGGRADHARPGGRLRGLDPDRLDRSRPGQGRVDPDDGSGVVDRTLVERGRITRYDPATHTAVVARSCAALATGCADAVDPIAVYRQALTRFAATETGGSPSRPALPLRAARAAAARRRPRRPGGDGRRADAPSGADRVAGAPPRRPARAEAIIDIREVAAARASSLPRTRSPSPCRRGRPSPSSRRRAARCVRSAHGAHPRRGAGAAARIDWLGPAFAGHRLTRSSSSATGTAPQCGCATARYSSGTTAPCSRPRCSRGLRPGEAVPRSARARRACTRPRAARSPSRSTAPAAPSP